MPQAYRSRAAQGYLSAHWGVLSRRRRRSRHLPKPDRVYKYAGLRVGARQPRVPDFDTRNLKPYKLLLRVGMVLRTLGASLSRRAGILVRALGVAIAEATSLEATILTRLRVPGFGFRVRVWAFGFWV